MPETAESPVVRISTKKWSGETWIAVVSSFAMFVGGAATLRFQVAQLETRADKAEAAEILAHANYDAKLSNVQDAQRMVESSHDHRITVLEQSYIAILDTLGRIEKKIDAAADGGGGHHH